MDDLDKLKKIIECEIKKEWAYWGKSEGHYNQTRRYEGQYIGEMSPTSRYVSEIISTMIRNSLGVKYSESGHWEVKERSGLAGKIIEIAEDAAADIVATLDVATVLTDKEMESIKKAQHRYYINAVKEEASNIAVYAARRGVTKFVEEHCPGLVSLPEEDDDEESK